LPKQAKAIKGLVPSLHYKLLTNGQSVTLQDGSIVTPEMVCENPLPSQCFAFIFLPDVSYLKHFCDNFENTMFKTFSLDQINSNLQKLVTVYHSVPKEVMLNKRYLEVISSQWGPGVKHILDCPESNIPVLSKSKANYHTEKIKMVCPLLIPIQSGEIKENFL
jgi:hypothetical protein